MRVGSHGEVTEGDGMLAGTSRYWDAEWPLQARLMAAGKGVTLGISLPGPAHPIMSL